jgi:hypothetical protein
MKLRTLILLAGLLALVLSGCRSNPVYNVTGMPVTTTTRGYKLGDVRGAILQAGAAQGWQMKAVRPGLIVGTLYVRDHMAQVEIPYDRNTYSILYRDSNNLKYDGVNIHSNYNGWVQRLNAAINARLSLL